MYQRDTTVAAIGMRARLGARHTMRPARSWAVMGRVGVETRYPVAPAVAAAPAMAVACQDIRGPRAWTIIVCWRATTTDGAVVEADAGSGSSPDDAAQVARRSETATRMRGATARP
jgi:hypothetical protein